MSKIKIAFAGVGSIAVRHLKNVAKYMEEAGKEYEVDIYRSSYGKPLDPTLKEKITRQFALTSDSDIKGEYDVVFITNPTALHFATLKRFQRHGRAFFIEKPVFDTDRVKLEELVGLKDKVCYVACPLRYHPVIDYIKKNIDCDRVLSARAICSSYLPEWRPGIDYRECYSAHSSMGGGVDIDLIHEWDYLVYLFGSVVEGCRIAGKLSSLEIDSNDVSVYIAKTESAMLELHLDYFGRQAIRKLQLFMPEETIDCDIQNGCIHYLKSDRNITFDQNRDSFQIKEIKRFFEIVQGKKENDSTIEHGLRVLRYAKGEFR